MAIKLLGVVHWSVNGVPMKKIHYKDEYSNHAIEISGDSKRMSAAEICEVVAGKEKIPVKDIVMRRSLKHSVDKKAKKAKKGGSKNDKRTVNTTDKVGK